MEKRIDIYNITCIKRPLKESNESGLLQQVVQQVLLRCFKKGCIRTGLLKQVVS